MKGILKVMNDIKNEFNKLSKQGKINVHYYLIHIMTICLFLLLALTVLALDNVIIKQENQIEQLQEKVKMMEQIQNNLIVHINRVGG